MKQLIFGLALMVNCLAFSQEEKIVIHQDERIERYAERFRSMYRVAQPRYVYRIQLISTYQRDDAYTTRSKFRNLFPNESSFLEHDGVKFIVRAGSFEQKAEAEIMLRDIRKNFPASFILPPELVEE